MKLSNFFKVEDILHLDKKTLLNLRWIAHIGQILTILTVFYLIGFDLPLLLLLGIIGLGILTNLFILFQFKQNIISEKISIFILLFDLTQISFLLYLTGGILNPFLILIIVPSIVSSTFLSVRATAIMVLVTIFSLIMLTYFHQPLPGSNLYGFNMPKIFILGIFLSVFICLIFLSYFGVRFSLETKKRDKAFSKLQELIANEHEVYSLGSQAAAAAHSLGTPLSTINVIAAELKKELSGNKNVLKDIDLLISQTERCKKILKAISQNELLNDQFLDQVNLEQILSEIIKSFEETTSKKIHLDLEQDHNKITIKKIPELIYGLRNFIGNAVKFSNEHVYINLITNNKQIMIIISDDGPGFQSDVINSIGDPYLKSTSGNLGIQNKSGLGLGTFLGKTLLEKLGANLHFSNLEQKQGAKVVITWQTTSFKSLF